MIFLDFETLPIGDRPDGYPPAPVGLAVKTNSARAKYLAWRHPSKNNSTLEKAKAAYLSVVDNNVPVFHNAAFDLEVAQKHFQAPIPKKFHCTNILAFLVYPHEPSFKLKTLATKYLGYTAEERDELQDWILKNIPEARRSKAQWGKFIFKAPADLVGRYVKADVDMTADLFKFLWGKLAALGMQTAYQLELDLLPYIIQLEQRGVEVDVRALKAQIPELEKSLALVDSKIRRRLKFPTLDLDKKGQLAEALQAAGKVDDWPLTQKGLDLQEAGLLYGDNYDDYRSTSHKLLKRALNDKFLWHLLFVRGKVANCLRNFARPWHDKNHKGKIYIRWSTTRKDSGGGARTGRLSSSPNLQNVPGTPKLKQFLPGETDTAAVKKEKKQLYDLYKLIPNMRSFIVPGKGNAFAIRDYSQQEMRLLAHFENGPLMEAYNNNPKLDIHTHAANLFYDTCGLDMRAKEKRTPVKIINFGRIYGMGAAKLADEADISLEDAKKLSRAHKLSFPGVTELDDDLKSMGFNDLPIKTLGGRKYFAEEPAFVVRNKVTGEGRWFRFEYKLLNYLIQGSAADMLKIAMLQLFREGIDVVLTVHDEIVVCAPVTKIKKVMSRLTEIMESIKLDVPLFSDGEIVYNNWGEMIK